MLNQNTILEEKLREISNNLTPLKFRSALDALLIDGAVISPEVKSGKAIIFCHGRSGTWATCLIQYIDLAIKLYKAGFTLFFFSFRGHGHSDGADYSYGYFEQRDVLGMLKHIEFAFPQITRLGMLGYSIGAMAAMLAIEKQPGIKALVSESGYSSFEKVATFTDRKGKFVHRNLPEHGALVEEFKQLKGWDFDISAVSALKQMAPCALYLIDGEYEREDNQFMFDLASGPKQLWLSPGASHGEISFITSELYTGNVFRFFLSYVV